MEKRFVINLGRELGSGGRIIAQRVAEKLGVSLLDKKLIQMAAKQSGICGEVFEKVDEYSAESGILTNVVSYIRSTFSSDDSLSTNILSADTLFSIQSDVIRDVASRESALFVGRCADYVLRDHPLAINIFISADIDDRIARIADSYEVDPVEARRIIEKGDASRAQYYNFYSTGEWGHSSSYHLCINSSLLGLEATADYIIEFVKLRLTQQ